MKTSNNPAIEKIYADLGRRLMDLFQGRSDPRAWEDTLYDLAKDAEQKLFNEAAEFKIGEKVYYIEPHPLKAGGIMISGGDIERIIIEEGVFRYIVNPGQGRNVCKTSLCLFHSREELVNFFIKFFEKAL